VPANEVSIMKVKNDSFMGVPTVRPHGALGEQLLTLQDLNIERTLPASGFPVGHGEQELKLITWPPSEADEEREVKIKFRTRRIRTRMRRRTKMKRRTRDGGICWSFLSWESVIQSVLVTWNE